MAAPSVRRSRSQTDVIRSTHRARRLEREQAPTWQLVRAYVEEEIALGHYQPGGWLPSVRELAKQLKINRNTVSKVYQSLGREHVLESVHGRGVRVAPVAAGSPSPESRLLADIGDLVEHARAQGVGRDWLVSRMSAIARDAYAAGAVRIGFVECTPHDVQVLASDLSGHLGIEVVPLVLSSVLADPQACTADMDIIATTLFHLQELNEAMSGLPPQIIGMTHSPSYETLLQIARLKPGITIAIVSTNERTLDLVQRIVGLYARGRLLCSTTGEELRLLENLDASDVVICDSASQTTVQKLRPRASIISVEFHLERESMEYLRESIHRHRDAVSAAV